MNKSIDLPWNFMPIAQSGPVRLTAKRHGAAKSCQQRHQVPANSATRRAVSPANSASRRPVRSYQQRQEGGGETLSG